MLTVKKLPGPKDKFRVGNGKCCFLVLCYDNSLFQTRFLVRRLGMPLRTPLTVTTADMYFFSS